MHGFAKRSVIAGKDQGCQMVYFQTKTTNFGKFWRALHSLENVVLFYVHLEYFADIWYILMTIWYILCSLGAFFPGFGIMHQEKSGNPGKDSLLGRKLPLTYCDNGNLRVG
jgi:hypothetical protein